MSFIQDIMQQRSATAKARTNVATLLRETPMLPDMSVNKWLYQCREAIRHSAHPNGRILSDFEYLNRSLIHRADRLLTHVFDQRTPFDTWMQRRELEKQKIAGYYCKCALWDEWARPYIPNLPANLDIGQAVPFSEAMMNCAEKIAIRPKAASFAERAASAFQPGR